MTTRSRRPKSSRFRDEPLHIEHIDPEKTAIIVTKDVLPPIIPIFPVEDRPFFPKMKAPLIVTKAAHRRIFESLVKSSETYLGLVLTHSDIDRATAGPDVRQLYKVGTVGKIVEVKTVHEGESLVVLMQMYERFTTIDILSEEPTIRARVEYWYEGAMEVNNELKAYSISVINCIKELIQMKPMFREELNLLMNQLRVNDPGPLTDFAAFLTTASGAELQDILETRSIRTRIEKVLVLLKKEQEVSKLQLKINKRIEERLSAQQREFFLREQLKEIRKELGITKDDKESEIDRLRERLKPLVLSEEAQERIDEELNKLSLLEPSSPEFNVTRAYLDWLTILPWGKYSRDRFNLPRAAKILDRDHYGLSDVKDRILEFVAVGSFKGDLSGSILLLVGPPGVGKTSIGKAIAASIGRKFYRFSLGGMRDEAEIKGHRRTYIGALPGKFINAVKTCKTANPVIMLDEIDKIGASFRGDPASALLEVLDPEQNREFLDHYLDVRFDLSRILFVCTANQVETIPSALLDRMEVIRLSGYILEEKLQIAQRHLIPRQLKRHGLSRRQIKLPDPVVHEIIDGYSREAGVRGLENNIRKIIRKSAKRMVEKNLRSVHVGLHDLFDFLGPRLFDDEMRLKTPRVGVVTGLAYTSMGGSTLYIEAAKTPAEKGGFRQTGQLGAVMVESSEIAFTYVQSISAGLPAIEDFFRRFSIHLHVPAGATPKDGPSAGITMACAIYSLVHDRPIQEGIAMTGELTLSGLVMPIGGVKEKLLAARRSKLSHIIFPAENKKDFDQLESYVTRDITASFVSTFEDVLNICFPT